MKPLFDDMSVYMGVLNLEFCTRRGGGCKQPKEEEHTCPFAMEIHDDEETKCHCCQECAQECADDI